MTVSLTKQAHQTVEDDEWRADVPFVAVPCKGEHDDRSQDVWWSNKTLRFADAEAHTLLQYDGQEVGDGVGASCRETEE